MFDLRLTLTLYRRYRQLFFWKGSDSVVNPNTVDPYRLCSYEVPFTTKRCLGVKKSRLDTLEWQLEKPKMVEIAFVAIVGSSAVLEIPFDRSSKSLWVVPPAICADRIQSVIALGLRQLANPVRAQIETNSFELGTRRNCHNLSAWFLSDLYTGKSSQAYFKTVSAGSQLSGPDSPSKKPKRSNYSTMRKPVTSAVSVNEGYSIATESDSRCHSSVDASAAFTDCRVGSPSLRRSRGRHSLGRGPSPAASSPPPGWVPTR